MSDRDPFEAVRELAYGTESPGVALCACSAEHVLKTEGPGWSYVRELRQLARAIGAELESHMGHAVDTGQHAPESILGNACDVRLFARALATLGDEFERLGEGGGEAP
jgi:hypothetical protein